jgi:hypothetical protein
MIGAGLERTSARPLSSTKLYLRENIIGAPALHRDTGALRLLRQPFSLESFEHLRAPAYTRHIGNNIGIGFQID